MEENRFDPLQFIGFLLISGILMFWFYDNQSNMIENQQEEIVDDSQIEVVEQPSNIVDSSYNDYEDNDEFSEEIIVLENSNILLEVSTKGAEIKKLLLKDFKDVPGGFPKSDLLGVTVALIHVAAQRCLAV